MRSVFDLEPAPLDAHAERSEFEEDAEADRSSPRYVRWVQQALNQLLGLRLAVDRAGEAELYGYPPRPMDVARAIAYDVGLGHGIMSYWYDDGLHLGTILGHDPFKSVTG